MAAISVVGSWGGLRALAVANTSIEMSPGPPTFTVTVRTAAGA
jgi:hypothetical protein